MLVPYASYEFLQDILQGNKCSTKNFGKYSKKPCPKKHPLHIDFQSSNLFQALTINEVRLFSFCPAVNGLLNRLFGQPDLLTINPTLSSLAS
jgi:hypothetical protein